MDWVRNCYPIRTSIKERAREQLNLKLNAFKAFGSLDEKLFSDTADTLFTAYEFERPLSSWEQAAEVEDKLAAELVEIYLHIKSKQSNPIVQKLNALLSMQYEYSVLHGNED